MLGPKVEDGVILLSPITSAADLPERVGDLQEPVRSRAVVE